LSPPLVNPSLWARTSINRGCPVCTTTGGWFPMTTTTLACAGDTITVNCLTDTEVYTLLIDKRGGGASETTLRFNGVSTCDYSSWQNTDGGGWADGGALNCCKISDIIPADDNEGMAVVFLSNRSSRLKLSISMAVYGCDSAGTAPHRRLNYGKLDLTTDVTRVCVFNAVACTNFGACSSMAVLGLDICQCNCADNAWTELADVSIACCAAATLSSGTIAANKWLWISTYIAGFTASADGTYRFNGDSGCNYSHRDAFNGAADNTTVSDCAMLITTKASNTPVFANTYMLNNSGTTKFAWTQAADRSTVGSSVANDQMEFAGKWANVCDSITSIVLTTTTSTFAVGTRMKIWGNNG